MSTSRSLKVDTRRKPDSVRRQALEIGRRFLIAGGPRAVTLKAIGAEMGMSHANLIHHFGSAEQLRAQLRDSMVQNLTRASTILVKRNGKNAAGLSTIVDKVFDTYATGGIGMLMAWTATSGTDHDSDEPAQAIRELVSVLETQLDHPDAARRARDLVSLVTCLAFADSLIGRSLAAALDGGAHDMRDLALRLLIHLRGGVE